MKTRTRTASTRASRRRLWRNGQSHDLGDDDAYPVMLRQTEYGVEASSGQFESMKKAKRVARALLGTSRPCRLRWYGFYAIDVRKSYVKVGCVRIPIAEALRMARLLTQ